MSTEAKRPSALHLDGDVHDRDSAMQGLVEIESISLTLLPFFYSISTRRGMRKM